MALRIRFENYSFDKAIWISPGDEITRYPQIQAMQLVRHSAQLLSPSEALQKVFVPFSTLVSPFYRHQHRHCPNSLLPPKVRHYFWDQSIAEPTRNSRRRDEEITDKFVQLVSPDSRALLPPERPRAILGRMDRKANFLIEVSPATKTSVAVCRIMSRQDVIEYEKSKSKKPKEQAPKQLELSWAIGPHDLSHKLRKMEKFLGEGRRVEVIIASRMKRRGAQTCEVSKEHRDKLLASIRAFGQTLDQVREWKAMQELVTKPEDEERDVAIVRRKPTVVTATLFFERDKNAKSTPRGPDVENQLNDQPENPPKNPPENPPENPPAPLPLVASEDNVSLRGDRAFSEAPLQDDFKTSSRQFQG